jgi:hypothetical protein
MCFPTILSLWMVRAYNDLFHRFHGQALVRADARSEHSIWTYRSNWTVSKMSSSRLIYQDTMKIHMDRFWSEISKVMKTGIPYRSKEERVEFLIAELAEGLIVVAVDEGIKWLPPHFDLSWQPFPCNDTPLTSPCCQPTRLTDSLADLELEFRLPRPSSCGTCPGVST